MAEFPRPITTLAGVLHKRHISPAEAIAIDLGVCTQQQAEHELDDRLGGNVDFCERLPYLNAKGEPLGFERFRINYKDAGTYVDREGKVQTYSKYRQKKGVPQQFVYLPHVGGIDWENVIHTPAEPLWITEGEYKSIAACQRGIPCVGLGGIWSFNKKGNNLPAPLDEAVWIGKPVAICFDADDECHWDKPLKKQVGHAALILASKLSQMGAKPCLVYIARTKTFADARESNSKAKMGLDDYLFAGGTPDELMATWVNPVQCGHLAALNSQYAVCRGLAGVGVMDIELGKLYRTHDFVASVENNRIRLVHQDGNKPPKEIRVADEFIKQADRPEVRQIVFEPADTPGYDRETATYNQWTGWPDLGKGETAEFKRDIDNTWRTLIEKLFGEHADYFEKWCAHLVQRPGEKTSIGVILVSVLNGVGKSLLGEVLRGVVGDVHGKKTELDRLKSNFNSVLERCLFLQMDEAEGLQERMESKLNDLITSDTVVVERKGFDAVTVKNYMRMYLTSNSMRPIRLLKENRRWLVILAGVTAGELVEWSSWCGSVAKKMRSLSGLAALRERLERVDLREWNPTARVVITSDAEDMAESARTWASIELDGLIQKCQEDWENGKLWFLSNELRDAGVKVWGDFKAHVKTQGGQCLPHQAKTGGKKQLGVVIDLDCVLNKKKDSAKDGKWVLDTSEGMGKFESSGTWSEAIMRVQHAWELITNNVKGDTKYSK